MFRGVLPAPRPPCPHFTVHFIFHSTSCMFSLHRRSPVSQPMPPLNGPVARKELPGLPDAIIGEGPHVVAARGAGHASRRGCPQSRGSEARKAGGGIGWTDKLNEEVSRSWVQRTRPLGRLPTLASPIAGLKVPSQRRHARRKMNGQSTSGLFLSTETPGIEIHPHHP